MTLVKVNPFTRWQLAPAYPTPRRIGLSESDQRRIAGILSDLTGISIGTVYPHFEEMGIIRVYSVTPYMSPDPPIVYAPQLQNSLRMYYRAWGYAINNGWCKRVVYDHAVRQFERTTELTDYEMEFALSAMKIFRNERVLR